MRATWAGLAILIGLSGVFGCASGAQLRAGTINHEGFVHGFDGYRIAFHDGALMSSEWQVRSHYRREDALMWQAKRGPAHETTVRFENSNDGRAVGRATELVVDLSLSHRVHSGFVWVASSALPTWSTDTDLGVIAHDVLQGFSRGEQLISASGWVHADNARFATRVVQSRVIMLSGWPAVDLTFDWVNLNDREVAVGRVWRRVRLVIARSQALWHPRNAARSTPSFPLVFTLGYASLPGDFERGQADFERLLSNLQWADDRPLLNAATPAVVACVPGQAAVALELSVTREGGVSQAHELGVRNRRDDLARCFRQALSHVTVTPTGQPRWIAHVFGPYQTPVPQTLPQPENEVAQATPPAPTTVLVPTPTTPPAPLTAPAATAPAGTPPPAYDAPAPGTPASGQWR